MAITVGVNSYISVADADTYFGDRLYADDWTSANSGIKEKSLLMARRWIDMQDFLGARTDPNQMLAWPRIGIQGVNSTTVPQNVFDAQCELALAFVRSDLTLNDDNRNVRRLREQVGAIVTETEYDGRAPAHVLPDAVSALLRPYFAATENPNSVAMVL